MKVVVERLDGHAASLARAFDGAPVRVLGGVPGDTLDVRVVARGRSGTFGTLRRVIEPSPARRVPPCRIADRCGACPWQSVRYREQLTARSDALQEQLRTLEGFETLTVEAPVGLGHPFGYRTKIQMPAGQSGRRIAFGFWAPRSHEFVPAHECVVQHPLGEAARAAITDVLRAHGRTAWDPETGEGDVRALLIRVAEGTGHVGAVLVVSDIDGGDWGALRRDFESISGLTGLWLNENRTATNVVLGSRTEHLAGARRFFDVVAGVRFERSPTGFFQTNHRATEQLIALVREVLPERMGTLWDLYAGGGLFAAALADRVDRVVLVEAHADALDAARSTLEQHGVDVVMEVGRVDDVVPGLADRFPADAAVIDPPRAGLTPAAVDALVASGPEWIVYVSCRTRSLRRDLARLCETAYRPERVACVDMFPHTPHVESVSLLKRRQGC